MAAIELVDKRRGSESKFNWMPFDTSVAYQRTDWWEPVRYREDDPWFVVALRDGKEVGRVKLADRKMWLTEYGVDPQIAAVTLEIALIEVACEFRRQGIGAEMVRVLGARHPDRRIAAFSLDADDFWESVAQPYDHLFDRMKRRLFICSAP